jgi:membrane protease subunit HflK
MTKEPEDFPKKSKKTQKETPVESPIDNPWDDNAKSEFEKKKAKKETSDPLSFRLKKDEGFGFFNSKNDDKSPQNIFEPFFNQIKSDFKMNSKKGGGGFGSGGGQNFDLSNPNNKKIFVLAMFVAIGVWLSSGFFRVQETDSAVVIRLGKVVRQNISPGLRYRLPFPIEQEIVKNTTSVKITKSEELLTARHDENEKNFVLTGDENIINISYTVSWNIKNLSDYIFNVRNPDHTILAAAESIIRDVIGQTDALSVLTEERGAISNKATLLLQKVLDHYAIGVQVVKFELQKVEAPAEVINAFNDMQASITDGDRIRIKAEAYRSEIIPKARGKAAQIVQEAEGYAQEVVARAEGEAERFTAIYKQYEKDPALMGSRLYIETMEKVLASVPKVIIDPKAAPGMIPYLNIQQNPNVISENAAAAKQNKENKIDTKISEGR